MTLPTSERSYFSDLKNNELNTSNAVSRFGGSPGLSTLYISTTASSGLKFLSTLSVSRINEPTLIPSISSTGNFDILSSFIFSITSLVISSDASKKISPVFSK